MRITHVILHELELATTAVALTALLETRRRPPPAAAATASASRDDGSCSLTARLGGRRPSLLQATTARMRARWDRVQYVGGSIRPANLQLVHVRDLSTHPGGHTSAKAGCSWSLATCLGQSY